MLLVGVIPSGWGGGGGEGPPGAPYGPMASYRARMTTPLQLEEVLIRHPSFGCM